MPGLLPDMDADARHLVGLLGEGGRLGVSTWAKDSLEDVMGCLFDTVAELTGVPMRTPPARAAAARIETEVQLSGWLDTLGLLDVRVTRVPLRRRLNRRRPVRLPRRTGAHRRDHHAATGVRTTTEEDR